MFILFIKKGGKIAQYSRRMWSEYKNNNKLCKIQFDLNGDYIIIQYIYTVLDATARSITCINTEAAFAAEVRANFWNGPVSTATFTYIYICVCVWNNSVLHFQKRRGIMLDSLCTTRVCILFSRVRKLIFLFAWYVCII